MFGSIKELHSAADWLDVYEGDEDLRKVVQYLRKTAAKREAEEKAVDEIVEQSRLECRPVTRSAAQLFYRRMRKRS